MPKPKRKRISKISARDVTLDVVQQPQCGVLGSTQLPRHTSSEEREAFELPDLVALVARLRLDLDRETDPARRLRLYDLSLQELEAARDKGARLYTMQSNAGELVNPEDVEAYAARLVELIAKLRIERERLKLGQELSQPVGASPELGRLVKSSIPSTSTFAPASPAKVFPDILTAAETAELLRLKLVRFYQVYRSLGIPFFSENSQLRFRKAKVEAWVEKREKEALEKTSGARCGRTPKPKKLLSNNQPTLIEVVRENEASESKPEASPARDVAYSLSGLNEAINVLAGMLVRRRWLDLESGPRFEEWITKPKDFSGPPMNWLVGTMRLYSFVVCLCHANILVLEPGSKKKGPSAPQYEPVILRAFLTNGKMFKKNINRTVMKHEAAVKHFREVLTSYATGLYGVDRRTDSFLDNIDIFYLHRQSKDFSTAMQRLEQGMPMLTGKSPISVFSVIDDQVLMLLRNLIADYPVLLEIEPTL